MIETFDEAAGGQVDDADVSSAAFEAWVAAHADALTRFALLVTGDRDTADDAVQEALSRALPRWDRVCRADDPAAYVRRMIVNAHITWWRGWRRRVSPVADVVPAPADASGPSGPPGPDDEIWARCLGLPPRQRAAVVLRFYEGLTYTEVADVLGISAVTARTQTHRALRTLRLAIEEENDD